VSAVESIVRRPRSRARPARAQPRSPRYRRARPPFTGQSPRAPLRHATRHGTHRRDRGVSARRSGVPRLSRHDGAQPLAVSRRGTCLCVPVLRHLLDAQRVERGSRHRRRRPVAGARAVVRDRAHAPGTRERAQSSTSRAARGAWRRLSASIAGTTASTCFAAASSGSAATEARSAGSEKACASASPKVPMPACAITSRAAAT
jgi:hypothetical protein